MGMRRLVLVGLCALGALAAGCGSQDDPAPAAAPGEPVRVASATPEVERRAIAKAAAAARPAAARREPRQAGASDAAPPAAAAASAAAASVLRGSYKRLNGELDDLSGYGGRVVLVVNTATQCGFTPQFEGLEALYRERRGRGLMVLGFPADDFRQESRSDEEIATFCEANYGVTFPMFAKTRVTGAAANPLFRALNTAKGEPEWNFNKYLVDRRGKVVARFTSATEPRSPELEQRIDELLAASA